jgi:HK97 family phage prohead protease
MMQRRGVCQTGTVGVANYAYRSVEPSVRFLERAEGAEGAGSIVGYAAVWNRYSANLGGFVEQFLPGAFDVSMRDDDQIGSYNHDYETLLGRRSAGSLMLETDNVGLRYEIPFDPSDTDHVRVHRKIVRGDLRGSSFSFDYTPEGDSWSYTEQGMLLCTVSQARLFEVAPVVWPAYPATEEDAYAVSLRSLAAQSGRDIGDLVGAAMEGRLTEVVGDRIEPVGTDGDEAIVTGAARARAIASTHLRGVMEA